MYSNIRKMMSILFQGPVIVKSLTLGTLIMIVLTFFTSRISHFNCDNFMVIIFQVCSLCLGVRRIDNASVFSYGFSIRDHPDSIMEP